MRAQSISIIGAGDGPEVIVSGPRVDPNDGIEFGKGQVDGLYYAPVDTEWSSARQQRGASFKGVEIPGRDMTIGFHTFGFRHRSVQESMDFLRSLFTYHLDPWWPGDELARICVESDTDFRQLHVQMVSEPELAPEADPQMLAYGNVIYTLRAAQPFWESPTEVTSWETGSSSGSGTITVSNPTDIPMFQRWVLTPGTWTIADHAWTGRPRHRVPADARTITLHPVTTTMGGLVVDLDPAAVMMSDQAGTNVMGDVGGGYYFMHEIPPHTPATELPISVSGAPAGGARAELHQDRLWSAPWGAS